ncbi:MAG: hypothetical protein U0T81_14735 [Saprospiraceae bacterium]
MLNYQKGFSKNTIRLLAEYFSITQEAFNRPYDLKATEQSRKMGSTQHNNALDAQAPDSRPSPVPDVTGHPKCDNDIEKQRTYKDFKSLAQMAQLVPLRPEISLPTHKPTLRNPQRAVFCQPATTNFSYINLPLRTEFYYRT